jgi:hypothetical protein
MRLISSPALSSGGLTRLALVGRIIQKRLSAR